MGEGAPPPDLWISRRWLGRTLAGASALVVTLGIAAELALHLLPPQHLTPPVLSLGTLLSLSYEGNLPTWYTATLLALCAALLALCAAQAAADRWRWRLLALGFLYISFDETVGIHEAVGAAIPGTRGIWYFAWVIPGGLVVIVLGLLYLPFLRRLAAATRRRFVLAGAIYVTGALLLELPLGLWTEHAGADNLGYAVIDLIEESLEILGLSLFLLAVVDHLAGPARRLALTLGPRGA